ncbi:thiaminase II [Sphingobacterium sp. lm-10]|uniref:thiaminase II n=1 Tax=Sphingobacterium sp. lm-10 TaxID=2944904 RepID=UPI002020CF99|nr:thiaminase II [Sphingobacterium sp. lm-10]MCL7986469.1 thiaminase II [Sphingobacterium sp. lm-10]
MSWSNKAWTSIEPIYEQIINMPFIQELQHGNLALEKFQFYMQQDARYLEQFGRVLAYIGSKTSDNEQAIDFFDFAKNALIVEKALHETYFTQFNVVDTHADSEVQPVCHHYIHFLKSTAAFAPLEVAVAAVLPCFWIYKVVGDHIYKNSQKDNRYHAWIDTYSGEEFAEGVHKAIAYADNMANNTTAEIRDEMWEAFEKSSQLEYQFWDAAYQLTRWKK